MLRTLVVGVGTRGRHWARIVFEEAATALAGLVEPSAESRAQAGGHPWARHAAWYGTIDEALADASYDLAVLATPPDGHLDQCRTLFDAGLPVLAEKPLALDMTTAVDIVRLADERGALLRVGLNFRFLPVTLAYRDAIAGGEIGRPGMAHFHYWRNRDGRRPGINKYPLTMEQPMLLEQTIHHVDLLRFVYGSEVVRVSARTHNPHWSMYRDDATVTALLDLDNGMLVSYVGTWSGQSQRNEFFWRTDGPLGALVQRELFDDLAFVGAELSEPVQRLRAPVEPFVDDTRGLLRAMISDVREGTQLAPSGHDHLVSLGVCFAALESSRSATAVDVQAFLARFGVKSALTHSG